MPTIEISFGELVDKLTILEIKAARIRDANKLENIKVELALLSAEWDAVPPASKSRPVEAAVAELRDVNARLWDIEDALRRMEKDRTFDATFISLARNVYRTNDERARVKKRLDVLLGSHVTEEKSYEPY